MTGITTPGTVSAGTGCRAGICDDGRVDGDGLDAGRPAAEGNPDAESGRLETVVVVDASGVDGKRELFAASAGPCVRGAVIGGKR